MKAEMAVLGTCLHDSRVALDTRVVPDYFGSALHRELFSLIRAEADAGRIVDVVTLSVGGQIESFGGAPYINDLLAHANIERFSHYEALLIEEWQKRAVRSMCIQASAEEWPADRIIGEAARIGSVSIQKAKPVSELVEPLKQAPFVEEKEVQRPITGIKKLDETLGGFQEGELTFIAARPSMGKTDVMLHFARMASESGCLPVIFSIEMSAGALTRRLLAAAGRLNRAKLRNPYKLFDETNRKNWPHVIREVSGLSLYVSDQPAVTVPDMRASLRRLSLDHPEARPVVFIDYLGLITPPHFFDGNTAAQVAAVSRSLKALAKDFSCPVICLAQLSRAVETRANKRPMLSDVRDSGSVEQDADVMLFLYREAYYTKEAGDERLEIIVAKNRNGPTGFVTVTYVKESGVLIDHERESAV
ncbi:replicative DNA helicase [Domibacillus indicus]|uniref:replicative DNA helicase n=1 Tax=Domibacillus indicus TaxID=1437523 RepID=UPI000617C57D|nr:DnaB-like helicase C-terminal domain-containing protein [Domibacillus indicus]